MTENDPLASVLSNITNAEAKGKKECLVHPSSKITKQILKTLKENGYIKEFEEISKERGGTIKIQLVGKINKCNVIKPRYSFTKKDYEKYEKRYLPAKNFGIIIVTTSKGIMRHDLAIEKGLGGKLLAYCY